MSSRAFDGCNELEQNKGVIPMVARSASLDVLNGMRN